MRSFCAPTERLPVCKLRGRFHRLAKHFDVDRLPSICCMLSQCSFYAYHQRAQFDLRYLEVFQSHLPSPLFTKNGTTYIRTSTPFITNNDARHPDFAHYPNYLGTSCALHTSNSLLLPSNATSDRVANNAFPFTTKYAHAYYL